MNTADEVSLQSKSIPRFPVVGGAKEDQITSSKFLGRLKTSNTLLEVGDFKENREDTTQNQMPSLTRKAQPDTPTENETLFQILKQQQTIIEELRNQNSQLLEKQKAEIKEEVMTDLRAETQKLLMMQMQMLQADTEVAPKLKKKIRNKKIKSGTPLDFSMNSNMMIGSPMSKSVFSAPSSEITGYFRSSEMPSPEKTEIHPFTAPSISSERSTESFSGLTIRQRMEKTKSQRVDSAKAQAVAKISQQASGERPSESPRQTDAGQPKTVSFSILEENEEDVESSDEEPSPVPFEETPPKTGKGVNSILMEQSEEEGLERYLDSNTLSLLKSSQRLVLKSRAATRQRSRRKQLSSVRPSTMSSIDVARKKDELQISLSEQKPAALPSLSDRRLSEAETPQKSAQRQISSTPQSDTEVFPDVGRHAVTFIQNKPPSNQARSSGSIPDHPLGETEWENEIAKNILTLYQTKMAHQFEIKQSEEEQARLTKIGEDSVPLYNRLSQASRRDVSPITGRGRTGSTSPNNRSAQHSPIRAAWGSSLDLKAGTSSSPQMSRNVPTSSQRAPKNQNQFVVKGPNAQEIMVVVPKKARPIWFTGTGSVQAEWQALVGSGPSGQDFLKELEGLEEAEEYMKYLAIVEALLTAQMRAELPAEPNMVTKRLWQQLIITTNAFGAKCTDQKKYPEALELLRHAETLIDYKDILSQRVVAEIKAYIADSYACYYYKRKKPNAALAAVQRAMRTHAKFEQWQHVAKCHLHSSCILSFLSRHDEAIRCLGQVLIMVEDGRLDVGGTSPQKLCLVAVAYHNIAVEQLSLRHISEACMSSQNARRLARLCLSYSNRWVKFFEDTHKISLAELANMNAKNKNQNKEQQELFKKLAMEFYG